MGPDIWWFLWKDQPGWLVSSETRNILLSPPPPPYVYMNVKTSYCRVKGKAKTPDAIHKYDLKKIPGPIWDLNRKHFNLHRRITCRGRARDSLPESLLTGKIICDSYKNEKQKTPQNYWFTGADSTLTVHAIHLSALRQSATWDNQPATLLPPH